jgi:hypothetical protein
MPKNPEISLENWLIDTGICGCISARFHLTMKTLVKKIEPKPEPEPYRSARDTAGYFCVDTSTLRRWRLEGCPAHKRGYRLVLYRIGEVERWLKTREAA